MAKADIGRRERLREFLELVTTGMGRLERRQALGAYLRGLLLAGERKNIKAVAQRIAEAPEDAEAYRQRMQQAVVVAQWDEDEVFERIYKEIRRRLSSVEALVIDDTGFAKKGRMSPCVQRQYSGTLGRVDNCQVAVSLHVAGDDIGACIGMRLFMPEAWADDEDRRKRAGIPEELEHRKKWEMALDMIDARAEWGLEGLVVLADAGYGECREFRRALDERELSYIVGIKSTVTVWTDGRLPESPEARRKKRPKGTPGPKITKWQRDLVPESVKEVAASLPAKQWDTYVWSNAEGTEREGRFAALRVRHAYRAGSGTPPGDEQWLLIQWNKDDDEPSHYWLSSLPAEEDVGRLVYLAKLRWRIERDYQELKGELGLDHFEGRTWNGFHHHCAIVAAAHAFLALERALFPPALDLAAGLSTTTPNGAATPAWALPDVPT